MKIGLDTKQIYYLENEDAQKRLVNHLMKRAKWMVIGPREIKFPAMIKIKDDYNLNYSTLETMVKINDVWYENSLTVDQLGKNLADAIVVNV